jgi:hypothetical protein
MRKLMIVSSSSRMLKEPKEPISAKERFDGILMRITRNYISRLRNVDVLILSPTYGLITPEKKIPYHEPIGGGWKWNRVQLSKDKVEAARKSNLITIRDLVSKRKYDEIYVNVGKAMFQLIEGFEGIVPKTTKITCAQGRGIGPKVAHMKNWMELQLVES